VLEDKFSVACLVAIELKAGLVGDQRLKQRLAFDELKVPDVTAIKVQEVERIVDEPLAVIVVAYVRAKFGNPASSSPQSSPSR
jgi:hypothetical protein